MSIMKKALFSCLFVCLSFSLFAQDCDQYLPSKKGAVMEMTAYDKKGKPEGIITTKVLDIQGAGSNQEYTILSSISDDKGKNLTETEYTFKCESGQFLIDMRTKFGNSTLSQLQNMELEVDGDMLEFPSNPSVGQELTDATMTMKVKGGGIGLMSMTANIFDRKVVAKEKVETPAGTFDCYKIAYTIEVKVGIRNVSKAEEWYSKGVGVVKSVSYDKKGKQTGSSLLTKLEL